MNFALFTFETVYVNGSNPLRSEPIKLLRPIPDSQIVTYILYAKNVNSGKSCDSGKVSVRIIRGNP